MARIDLHRPTAELREDTVLLHDEAAEVVLAEDGAHASRDGDSVRVPADRSMVRKALREGHARRLDDQVEVRGAGRPFLTLIEGQDTISVDLDESSRQVVADWAG